VLGSFHTGDHCRTSSVFCSRATNKIIRISLTTNHTTANSYLAIEVEEVAAAGVALILKLRRLARKQGSKGSENEDVGCT